jgi:sulfite exporter TauE/SafE
VLGALWNAISFDSLVATAFVIILVSLVMIILGLQMVGVSWAQKFRLALPKAWSVKAVRHDSRPRSPYIIGAATFFLPCGFTLIAQGVALASGSLLAGALIMGAFALGTLPILAGISWTGVRASKRPHLTARFQVIAGALVLVFALYNINSQLNVLGYPSASDAIAAIRSTETETSSDPVAQNEAGEQVLGIRAVDFDYIPTTPTTLQAGKPTRLIVQNDGILGCGAFMAARGLWEGSLDLKPGVNEITFTPQPGTYKISCTMGMVPPVTVTVR